MVRELRQTRLGLIAVESDGGTIRRVEFDPAAPATGADALTTRCFRELTEFFDGIRREFTLPLHPAGTPFQLRVWAELRMIPYGATISYGELARRIGNPRAGRAVGMANHRNPIAILIPCHRVIGSNGDLTGYGGGLSRKKTLLNLEQGELL